MIQATTEIQRNGIIGNNVNPTKGTSFVSQGGVDYLLGAFFILLGIMIFIGFQKKANIKYKKYKADQLALYNKNRGSRVSDYNATKLYVPFWEKAKFTTPIFLTVLFVVVGMFFILWTATGTPANTL